MCNITIVKGVGGRGGLKWGGGQNILESLGEHKIFKANRGGGLSFFFFIFFLKYVCLHYGTTAQWGGGAAESFYTFRRGP